MLRKGIGIDVGSTQISISSAEGGLLLRDLNVAAIDVETGKVIDAGASAVRYLQEFGSRVELCWPAWDKVVRHADVLAEIFRIFLRRALGRGMFKPEAMVSIPCDLTEAQTNAVEDALLSAGAHRVHFLEAPLCAALGVGFDFSAPSGQMIIHMGASRTEVAIVFLGDMVTFRTDSVGGNAFDEAIIEHMKREHHLHIGKRTAEQIKIRIGDVSDHEPAKKLDVKGRCLDTGEQRVVTLCSRNMLSVLQEPIMTIFDLIHSVILKAGDEMRADVAAYGIVLTGSGVLMGFDRFLFDALGLQARIAPNAETAAVEGAAQALSKI